MYKLITCDIRKYLFCVRSVIVVDSTDLFEPSESLVKLYKN